MEQQNYICPNCGNTDPRYIFRNKGHIYCRKCITFSGEKAKPSEINSEIKLKLDYPLSECQKAVSDQVLKAYREHRNVLINAVTGAGKTELVFAAIEFALSRGQQVGFATPRKDVVLELQPRIKAAFPDARVIAVYGGNSASLTGDIVVLTTHQLYRYINYFDLLIVDEIDAFPFSGNKVLSGFLNRSVRGNKVLLSATPAKEDIKEIKSEKGVILKLNKRYHGGKLPVPIFKPNGLAKYLSCLLEIKKILKDGKQLFVFVPTIEIGQKLFFFVKFFCRSVELVYSSAVGREEKIKQFRNGDIACLITTSILERGVTVKDLQVIVFDSDHQLFSKTALIQISGRVGRKIGATEGKVILMGKTERANIYEAIETIKRTNREALLSDL